MAEIYDHQYDERQGKDYYGHISRKVLEKLPEGGFILDIGCGTGLFMKRYGDRGGHAIGLDISREMIRRARERCMEEDVTHGTAESLPFRDGIFDALASLLAFSYLQNPEKMLRESFRVLKPGGTIALCTLGKNVFTVMVPVIYTVGEKLRIRRVGMANFNEHYYDEEELSRLFSKTGFVDVTVERCSFAHVDSGKLLFQVTKKVEPFVEEKIPYLAFNICVSAKKPED